MNPALFFLDVEYSDPGGLQEKLERLNHIMSGEWDHGSRRAPYLNQCKYTLNCRGKLLTCYLTALFTPPNF